MALPSYAVAVIIILVILSVSSSVYFIFGKIKRGRGTPTGNLNMQNEEEYISEKNNTSPYAVRPLMQYNNNNIDMGSTLKSSQTSSSSTIPTTPIASPYEKATLYEKSSPIEDTGSSIWTAASDTETPLPPAPQILAAEFKISLPLPPPSSSFFSDKMELDSIEANALYASYMTVAIAQQDFVSIDLDDKPFLSNAAANISQKAATLRSTLRQSMRRKSSSGLPKIALNQFFDNASSTSSVNKIMPPSSSPSPTPPESTRMSRQSSSTSSRYPRTSLQQPPTRSPRADSPASASAEFFGKFSNNSSKKSLVTPVPTFDDEEPNSNKIMIEDDIPPTDLSYFSLPVLPSVASTTTAPLVMKTTIQEMQLQQQQEQEQEEYASIIQEIQQCEIQQEVIASSDEEGPDKDNEEQQDAALAARRLIRSASRKSRTRSTIITADESAQAMFNMIAASPSPTELPTLSAKTAQKYATLRKHNMEIDTKRGDNAADIQKWTNNYGSSSPSPKRAIMSSTLSGSATVSGKRMAKQQLKNVFSNGSSDNLLRNNDVPSKSVTLGRSAVGSSSTAGGPKSLRNLFTRPSMDEQQPATKIVVPPQIINKEDDMESNKSMVEETEPEEDNDNEQSDSSVLTAATPISPVTASQQQSPYSSKNNTLRCKMGNNVDTIRRMLQSSWSGNNLKESGSSNSLSSSSDYMGSIGSSSFRPIASPLGSINPRLQNQHLVSLSLKASTIQQSTTRNRPSMPIGFMNDNNNEEIIADGPMPTVSFSSSTVRTMIPAEDEEEVVNDTKITKKSSVMGNLLGGSQRQQQPKQPSKLSADSRKVASMNININKKVNTARKKTPAQIEREKYLKSLET